MTSIPNTSIPNNAVSQEDLVEWYRLQEELKRIKAVEIVLRQKIFGAYFPFPTEGTNSAPLADGWVLKGKYIINREIDLGSLGAMKEQFAQAGIATDSLVQYKPSLVLKEYRKLTEEQRHLFDRALIVKPGSPTLEIVLPAKAKKAGEQV